jgi:DNA-binding XRE family transcriptional regulator
MARGREATIKRYAKERYANRGPRREKLGELIALRKAKFPKMQCQEFCKLLGVSRMHMTTIEVGRKEPSLELALRWLEILGPEARMSMFGPLPIAEQRIRTIKRLQELSPEFYQAA